MGERERGAKASGRVVGRRWGLLFFKAAVSIVSSPSSTAPLSPQTEDSLIKLWLDL
jgi:hypothetical protein